MINPPFGSLTFQAVIGGVLILGHSCVDWLTQTKHLRAAGHSA
jgi:hypothetical protein